MCFIDENGNHSFDRPASRGSVSNLAADEQSDIGGTAVAQEPDFTYSPEFQQYSRELEALGIVDPNNDPYLQAAVKIEIVRQITGQPAGTSRFANLVQHAAQALGLIPSKLAAVFEIVDRNAGAYYRRIQGLN